jgi:hypothetical protein
MLPLQWSAMTKLQHLWVVCTSLMHTFAESTKHFARITNLLMYLAFVNISILVDSAVASQSACSQIVKVTLGLS